jgi:hypothetical protein
MIHERKRAQKSPNMVPELPQLTVIKAPEKV